MKISGWDVSSSRKGWADRKILINPSGYDSFKDEVKRYVVDLVDTMSLGSEIKDSALSFADNIGWQPARPSSMAGACVLMAGSYRGIEFNELLIDISKDAKKMPYTLVKWLIYLTSGGVFDA